MLLIAGNYCNRTRIIERVRACIRGAKGWRIREWGWDGMHQLAARLRLQADHRGQVGSILDLLLDTNLRNAVVCQQELNSLR